MGTKMYRRIRAERDWDVHFQEAQNNAYQRDFYPSRILNLFPKLFHIIQDEQPNQTGQQQ